MCGSDLHQYRRPKGQARATGIPMGDGPVIAGHEPCGVVVAVGSGRRRQGGADRPARDGASLSGLHPVQPLPLRLAAAVPGGAGQGLWQQRPWRPRAISEGARQHAGAAAGRIVVLGGRRDRLRLRHRLQRAAPDESFRQRHDRDFRPGPGRAGRHAICQGDGRQGDRARHQPAAAGTRQGVRRRCRWSIPARTIRSPRSRNSPMAATRI